MNIVIAGFGVAGATAAIEARKKNPKAEITLFGREKDLFYYRTRLPEVVSGAVSPDKVIVHPLEWYKEKNIEVRLGEALLEINPEEKIIRGSLGSRQTYDKLLLAVGAESNRPPFPGDKLANVFAVRSLHDAWSLYFAAKNMKSAVLIGGGLLGLEVGYAMTRLGLAVTVLERGGRILPRQTTPKSADLLRKKLAALGLEFIVNSEADRFEGAGKVENVLLKDGRDLKADAVLISAGVTPNLDLARILNLKIDKAIVVDEYLETSLQNVYAAGDCAQFPGAAGGLWTTSYAQGQTAGHNIAATSPAERLAHIPAPPSNTLKVAGIDLVSAGNIDPDGKLNGIEAESAESYRKVVLDAENRLIGFTNVGTTAGNKELNAALLDKKKISGEAIKGLTGIDFDFKSL